MRGLIITFLGLASYPLFAQQGNNDLLLNMYNQLEALQLEMQTLRGVVEEQGYQLRQLQQESRDRYLDLDQRLSAANPVAPQSDFIPQQTTPPAGIPGPVQNQGLAGGQGNPVLNPPAISSQASTVATTATAGSPATVSMNDDEIYNTALSLLLEQRRYDESSALFQQYIDTYPQGRRLTNALYWQGEALILLERLPQARDVFMRLMTEFPTDPKTPGAMLKLGVVYNQMGNRTQAEQQWRDLPIRFPESLTEIREAQRYLNQ